MLGLVLLLAAGPTVRLTPEVIRMGFVYRGEPVRIEGTASPGSSVIVVVRGPDAREVFNKKARAGPIWINHGKVNISGAPALFFRFTPQPIDSLLRPAEVDRYQLSRRAIERQMRIAPREFDTPALRSDYLSLRAEQGFYQVTTVGALAGPAYRVEFQWPRRAPPAQYQIRVYECREGVVTGEAQVLLKVVKVGFPAWMAWLADVHASLYGVLAVLLAVLAGFGIDFLAAGLRKKPAAAHLKEERHAEHVSRGH